MKCIFVLITIFIITAASRAGRRRAQEKHIKNILSKDVLSIHSSDYYYYNSHLFQKKICPNINAFITDELTDESKKEISDAIGKLYLEKIYTKQNFKYTYRENMKIEVSFDDVLKYKRAHCRPLESDSFMIWGIIILIFALLPIINN